MILGIEMYDSTRISRMIEILLIDRPCAWMTKAIRLLVCQGCLPNQA